MFATTESDPAVEVPLQTLSDTVEVGDRGGSANFELDAPTTGLNPGAYALVYQVVGAGSFATIYSRNLLNEGPIAPTTTDTPAVIKVLGPNLLFAAGVRRRLSAAVSVPNSATGFDTVAVYATATGAIDASSTLLGAVRKRLPVRSGQATAAVSVPITTASVPAGSYVLLARVTDAAGTATDATAGPVVTVGQPAANVGGTITKVTPSSRVGGPVAFTLTLTNFGNVAAVGPASLTVSLTGTDLAPTADVGLTAPILVRKLTWPLTIGPGRSANLRFQLRVPAAANGQNLYPLV